MEDCLFCMIAEGKIPSKKLYEDDQMPESAMEQFMARNFDNQYMAERFQSMSLNPEDATRNALP